MAKVRYAIWNAKRRIWITPVEGPDAVSGLVVSDRPGLPAGGFPDHETARACLDTILSGGGNTGEPIPGPEESDRDPRHWSICEIVRDDDGMPRRVIRLDAEIDSGGDASQSPKCGGSTHSSR